MLTWRNQLRLNWQFKFFLSPSFPPSPCSKVQSMSEGGTAAVVVAGFGVVVGMISLQDSFLMMWTSSRAKLPSVLLGQLALKIIWWMTIADLEVCSDLWRSSIYQGISLYEMIPGEVLRHCSPPSLGAMYHSYIRLYSTQDAVHQSHSQTLSV